MVNLNQKQLASLDEDLVGKTQKGIVLEERNESFLRIFRQGGQVLLWYHNDHP